MMATRKLVGLLLVCLPLLVATTASAADARIEVRVIEATPGAGVKKVDPKLKGLAKDLKTLPFAEYKMLDAHRKVMSPGERVSLEFPGNAGEKRFLVVSSHGRQRGGKLRFQLSIHKLKFDTLVAVPDGGTILVGGPRKGDKTIFFAVTASESVAARKPGKR